MARAYFEQALANPSVPPSVAAQIRLYLSQLALAADPPAFSASIFSAIRWESNANAGPGTQSVTLNGIDFTLDQQSVGREGWSALNIATMHYGWDLKRQGDRIEFDALAYSTAYFDKDLNDIDLDFFEVTLGPSFNMKRWGLRQDARLSLRHRRPRLSRLRSVFQRARRRRAAVELRRRAKRPRRAGRDALARFRELLGPSVQFACAPGRRRVLGATYSYYFTPAFVVTTQTYGQREDAEVGFCADWEIALAGGFAWTFDNPLWQARYPWTFQAGGGVIQPRLRRSRSDHQS